MFIVMVGNPIDGVGLYGPFDDVDEASYWSELNFKDTDWWICPVHEISMPKAEPKAVDHEYEVVVRNPDWDGKCDFCGEWESKDNLLLAVRNTDGDKDWLKFHPKCVGGKLVGRKKKKWDGPEKISV